MNEWWEYPKNKPNRKDYFLVTFEDDHPKHHRWVMEIRYDNIADKWLRQNGEALLNTVIAWRELPLAYQD